jgi:hypothetical protein
MKQVFITIILFVFVAMAGFGFLYPSITGGHHHEPGCPYMLGEQAVCTMDLLDHFTIWQKTFTTVLPTIFSLFLIGAVVLIAVYSKLYKSPLELKALCYVTSVYTASLNPYQLLFSKGILNPKAP